MIFLQVSKSTISINIVSDSVYFISIQNFITSAIPRQIIGQLVKARANPRRKLHPVDKNRGTAVYIRDNLVDRATKRGVKISLQTIEGGVLIPQIPSWLLNLRLFSFRVDQSRQGLVNKGAKSGTIDLGGILWYPFHRV
jgi:hypothetical protein